MKISKLLVISLAFVLVLSIFTGCGSSETETTGDTEPSLEVSEPTTQVEEDESTPTVDEPITVVEESAPITELPPMNQSTADGSFFLEITSPEQSEVIVDTDSIIVAGRTTVDAALSVDDNFVDIELDGSFEEVVQLEDGINIIEVVANIATGEQFDQVITVIYVE